MPKKSWIEKAAESGDWAAAIETAKKQLRKSAAQIEQGRAPREAPEVFKDIGGPLDAPEPADTSDDPVQEYIEGGVTEDEDGDQLPGDEQELVPAEPTPVATLAEAYEDYLERGGNRSLQERVLDHFGDMNVEEINRTVVIAASRKLYPGLTQAERAELIVDPLEEIIGGINPRTVERTAKPVPAPGSEDLGPRPLSGSRSLARWWGERARQEQAALEKINLWPPGKEYPWVELPGANDANLARIEATWVRSVYSDPNNDDTWARIERPKMRLGPPDPPVSAETTFNPDTIAIYQGRGSVRDHWEYKHRSLLSALKRPDGRRLRFGPPKRIGASRYPGVYYGHEPEKAGRPTKPDKLSRKEIQRAYRERKKAEKAKRKSKRRT